MNFVAFDVETAWMRTHICQIGIVVVRQSQIVHRQSWLIKPKGNKYDRESMSIHGITPNDTENAPCLADVWPQIIEVIGGCKTLVGHNARFDTRNLFKELQECNIEVPNLDIICTMLLAKSEEQIDSENYKLKTLVDFFELGEFREHDALEDATMTAKLLLSQASLGNAATIDDIKQLYPKAVFGSIEEPNTSKKSSSSRPKTKAKDVIGDPSRILPNHPLYGKTICFTGEFALGEREDLWQYVADIGAIPKDNVVKNLDYLVCGAAPGRSKCQKAYEYNDKGANIEIIEEDAFDELLYGF